MALAAHCSEGEHRLPVLQHHGGDGMEGTLAGLRVVEVRSSSEKKEPPFCRMMPVSPPITAAPKSW
jgi:hypothetical protein